MSPLERAAAHHYDRAGRVFILGATGVALFFLWRVFTPFFTAIAIAAVLDVVFYPLHAWLAHAFGGRRYLAAGVTVLAVVLCVIVPLVGMGFLFTKQALDLYQVVSAKAQDGTLDALLRFREWSAVEAWLAAHAPWVDPEALNLKGVFLSFLKRVSGYGVGFGTAIASNALLAIGTFAVVLFSLFFFLVDGARFARWAWSLAPLNDEHRTLVSRTFVQILKSAVLGSGLVALVQGFLGGLAFSFVGMRGVLWGCVMVFMSLVPVVGTALVWVPTGLLLLAQDRVWQGVFILAWGVGVISTVDNLIRLLVVRGAVQMHPLLIFFSVLGGLRMLGPLGVVYGPLALAMVQTLLKIYRDEFMGRPGPPSAPGPA